MSANCKQTGMHALRHLTLFKTGVNAFDLEVPTAGKKK